MAKLSKPVKPKKKAVKPAKPKVKSQSKITKTVKSKKMSTDKEKELIPEVTLKPFYLECYCIDLPGRTENPTPGWMFHEVIRLIKLMYKDAEHCISDWSDANKDPLYKDFADFLRNNWDKDEVTLGGKKYNCKPFEIEDIFKLEFTEHKRFVYNVFGIERIFKSLPFKLIGKETIHKKRTKWDKELKPYNHEFDDTYELYSLPLTAMFPELKDSARGRQNEIIYCVKMICTTTAKEHMIWVPREVAEKKDPIAAIAWTIQRNITNPKRIFRQGDIIIFEHSEDSKPCAPTPLTRKEYETLIVAET